MADQPPAAREPRPEDIDNDQVKRPDPFQDAQLTLQEGRMVLPGIQTLFGFQLTVVFNASFTERLPAFHQSLHYVSLLLIAVAIALVMAPAPYHRQVDPGFASRRTIEVASWLMTLSLGPMMLGVALDVYVLGYFLFRSEALSAGVAAGVLALFVGLWFVFPQWARRQRIRQGDQAALAAERERKE